MAGSGNTCKHISCHSDWFDPCSCTGKPESVAGQYCMALFRKCHSDRFQHCWCAGEPQAVAGKYGVALLAPTAFTFFADLLAQYEGASVGADWGDAWADPFPIGAVLAMLLLDTAFYSRHLQL